MMGGSDCLLAFDFGGTKLAVAIADLSGKLLLQSSISSFDCVDGAEALRRALDEGHKLVDQISAQEITEVAGIGLSTMGITLSDRVLMAPNVPGWESLCIPSAFTNSFPDVPLRIMNDLKSGALAELRCGALMDTRAGMYVNIGTGIGITLTLGTEVVEGANGAAGEIAYNLLSSNQPLGYRDEVAPFEEFAGGRFIGARASAHFHRQMTCKDVFQLAMVNQDARAFVDETVREMAFQLTNLVIAWDPEKVVFGGGMVGSEVLILPTIREYFRKFSPFPPSVEVAKFQNGAGLQGAIQLALDAFRQSNQ